MSVEVVVVLIHVGCSCCCVNYPCAHFCVIMCVLIFPQPGEENVEVHVDLNQGSCAVDGGGSVGASASVAVDGADPSVARESMMLFPLVGMKILMLALKSYRRMLPLLLVLLLPLSI